MGEDRTIRIAQSCAADPREAAEELHPGLAQPDPSLVLFFCSSEYDRDALAGEIGARFGGAPVVGCTTAGEIGPLGCRDGSLTGVSFAPSAGTAVVGHLDDLRGFGLPEGVAFARGLRRRLEDEAPQADAHNTFAFLLVDGLFGHEEQLAHALQEGLGDIPLVGGSAGDSMSFASTYIYRDGEFVSGSAVLVLITTPLPFMEFKTQHFEPTDERLVVTEADPAERVVSEINGLPAAEEYARMLGVDPRDLGPAHFAASPVVVLIDGGNYVRSIQKVNPDGSLKFYCADRARRRAPRGQGCRPRPQPRDGARAGPRPHRPPAGRARLRLHPAQAGDLADRGRADRSPTCCAPTTPSGSTPTASSTAAST